MGFKADTPENESNSSIVCDKDMVEKLLASNRIFRLLVNNFLTRSVSESRLRWTCCFHFSGISASK